MRRRSEAAFLRKRRSSYHCRRRPEMLAQNPGLGKFVWDEFQNGSSASLAKIMVAVLTIGIIGFLLDRVMLALQALFTHRTTS